jgi:hypothetical protein
MVTLLMNKKSVWNIKLKQKDPRGRPRSRWEQVDRCQGERRKKEHGRKLRARSFKKTEIHGEAWCPDEPHKG